MRYFAIGWLCCSILACGILNGDLQWRCRNEWTASCDQYEARDHLAFAAFLSLLGPITLVDSFFVTGFVQHGISYGTSPSVRSESPS